LLESQEFDAFFDHLELLDLSSHGRGKFLGKVNVARNFEVCNLIKIGFNKALLHYLLTFPLQNAFRSSSFMGLLV